MAFSDGGGGVLGTGTCLVAVATKRHLVLLYSRASFL